MLRKRKEIGNRIDMFMHFRIYYLQQTTKRQQNGNYAMNSPSIIVHDNVINIE